MSYRYLIKENLMVRITLKKRHAIKKSELSRLTQNLEEQIGEFASLYKSKTIELGETGGNIRIFLIDKQPCLMEYESWVFPTLRGLIAHPIDCRKITVDSGAVGYVVNGADIMRPGIISVTDDVRKGMPVQVVEERHGKPLAVCISLYDADGLMAQDKGKCCKNVHFIGDELWNLEV